MPTFRFPLINLYSRDLSRAVAFYSELGFVETFRTPASGKRSISNSRRTGSRIENNNVGNTTGAGVYVGGNNIFVRNNDVNTGGRYGIQLYDTGADVVVSDNFSNNSYAGIEAYSTIATISHNTVTSPPPSG